MNGLQGLRMLLVLIFVTSGGLLQAATINLFADLDGLQEVPANSSTGTGTAVIVYDDVTNILQWDITFSGLSGPATGMHFHGPAAPGSNAGVRVNVGGISGLTSPSIGATPTPISEAFEAELLAGLWYLNIHTAMFPGGEIRGQVQLAPIPLPAALWLFVGGLAGLVGWGAKHRKPGSH